MPDPDGEGVVRLPVSKELGYLQPTQFYLADFNGDGRMDILAVLEEGGGMVFEQIPVR